MVTIWAIWIANVGHCHPSGDGEVQGSVSESENERGIGGAEEGEIANENGVPWLALAPVSESESETGHGL